MEIPGPLGWESGKEPDEERSVFQEILAAHNRLIGRVHKTSMMTSRLLNDLLGCHVFIKAENLQKTGSFKVRGALNFFDTQDLDPRGVCCYSSGNHGQGVAYAAQERGVQATVFIPQDANPAKVSALMAYGARAEKAGMSVEDRKEACEAFASKHGGTVVPPYDHWAIISGQGTVMLEVVEELPLFDAALVPVGGGGLMAGCAMVLKALRPNTRVYACETQGADDARKSLLKGALLGVDPPDTIADGMRHQRMGRRNWEVIRQNVDAGLVCSDHTVVEAMKIYAQTLKQIVEPSGAVSLGCLLANRDLFSGQKVVLVASGGNIDFPSLCRLVSHS